jgi:TRAP-type C4-dicarboxylate transport system permease small subunit
MNDPTANLCLDPAFIRAITTYYNIAIGLAIILAVIMVIVGGYQMVLSTGNPTISEKGKKRIQNALFGLGLAILSGVFLNFLNPQIFMAQPCKGGTTFAPVLIEEQRAA